MEQITSLQNAKVKNIIKLWGKAKERTDQQLFIIEGARELSLALAAGYEIDSVFVCQSLFSKTQYPNVLGYTDKEKIYGVSIPVFQKIAYREGSDGILTLVKINNNKLADLKLSNNPFIIVLEAVEKPGNLGAILRTADAAKVDAIIVCDPVTDIYNPNTIRSSMGCTFTVQTAVCTSKEALAFLKKNRIASYAAELEASQWYHETDFRQASAIIMGTEADGLTDFWLENADTRIKIPMRGQIDSLNVSVSTAILSFEAMRQRGF